MAMEPVKVEAAPVNWTGEAGATGEVRLVAGADPVAMGDTGATATTDDGAEAGTWLTGELLTGELLTGELLTGTEGAAAGAEGAAATGTTAGADETAGTRVAGAEAADHSVAIVVVEAVEEEVAEREDEVVVITTDHSMTSVRSRLPMEHSQATTSLWRMRISHRCKNSTRLLSSSSSSSLSSTTSTSGNFRIRVARVQAEASKGRETETRSCLTSRPF